MNPLDKLLKRIDNYQRHHRVPAIIVAVMQKFGEHQGGYLAALITYYGFLSLFPLLLVATSLIQIALSYDVPLAHEASKALGNIFPNFGNDLQASVHASTKTGFGLAIGLIIAFFGARGVADAMRYTFDEIWGVAKDKRLGFPNDIGNSLQMVTVGGSGLIVASIASAFIQGYGQALWATILANLVSGAIVYLTLLAVFIIAKPKSLPRADVRRGALATAIMLQLLQLLGGFFVTQQLHNLSSLYGTFAIVLGLLAYLYLQAQILVYALVYNVVVRRHDWPRKLVS